MYLFNCSKVTYNNQHPKIKKQQSTEKKRKHTISSLQIGQASCAPAAAGAADIEVSPFSNEILEIKS